MIKLSEHCNTVQVPFLVTSVSSNEPILGYNVIQHLLQTVNSNNAIDLLRRTLPAANEAQVNALYKELKDNGDGTLGTVKVGRRNIVVPQQSSIVVSVPFKGRQLQPGCEALFVPSHQLDALGISTQEMLVEVKPNHAGRVKLLLCNPSKNDSVLSKGTLLGRFEKICSSIPFGIAGSSSDHVQTTVNQFTERCSPDTIDAIVSAVRLDEPTCSSISTPVKEAEAVKEQLIQGASLPIIDNSTLAKEQRNDEDISTILLWVQKGEKPTKQVTKGWSPAAKCLLREWAKLKVENGLLRREISYPREGIIQQVVLPKCFRKLVLKHLHNDLGHLGHERVLSFVRDRFYWAHMSSGPAVTNIPQLNTQPQL
uniref:Integrase zinc-binding domain-containing protein n=1 Tax=Magallana gigas TaxID=29159 RepID=A0A8W8NSV8_MAGGI